MEIDRKNRTRRLIQLGAIAEKYLQCEGVSPEGFEERVKQLTAAQPRERAAVIKTDNTVNAFLRDLACLAGTGNGIGASTVERLKVLATKLGYISGRLREGKNSGCPGRINPNSNPGGLFIMKKKELSQEVLRLHALGMAADAIAAYMGVDMKTVQWVLAQAGEAVQDGKK